MVHFIGRSGSGSGSGGSGYAVSFSPPGGVYTANSTVNVTISVTNAPKLRWKINSTGAWTTVSATSTVVAISISLAGKTLYADALNAGGAVVASRNALYEAFDGGN